MLICPLCQGPLGLSEDGATCPGGHRFDRARQGYLNLLPVQHKKSRDPGDNQAMVEARRRFLDAGHYAPLAERLAALALDLAPQRWLDIGCGEGFYTARLAQALPAADGFALDISREAVKRACRRAPGLTWMVASMARVPLASATLDLLLSVFSPLDWHEAQRLLRPGGALLMLGPARDHLLELRQKLYEDVREYDDGKHLARVPDGLKVVGSDTLSFRLRLDDAQARADLLAMTPHGWRASAERRQAVVEEPLEVTVAVRFDIIERHAH